MGTGKWFITFSTVLMTAVFGNASLASTQNVDLNSQDFDMKNYSSLEYKYFYQNSTRNQRSIRDASDVCFWYNPCENIGVCQPRPNKPAGCICECYKQFYIGKECVMDNLQERNYCDEDENLCQNGGTCKPMWGSYFCECLNEFEGRKCEVKKYGGTTSNGRMSQPVFLYDIDAGTTDTCVFLLFFTKKNVGSNFRFEFHLNKVQDYDAYKEDLYLEVPARWKSLLKSKHLSAKFINEKQQETKATVADDSVGNEDDSPDNSPYYTATRLEVTHQLLSIILLFVQIIFMILLAFFVGFNFDVLGLGREGSQIEVNHEKISTTFADVKGVDEAKQELKYIVEFLKNPEKFTALGAKLPRGVLLVGPPGTGKTLLARAVAGEAGVPFFSASGSEFDGILVGQGARRVRNLFDKAKKRAPSIIFIDEIDSIGSRRTGTYRYDSQTINQLLTEIDGFHKKEGVIVLGATNRRDDLDEAILRPGRFDVEVTVPVPDYVGRKEILELYLGQIVSKGINVEKLARGSTGFTGADLENMVNQAALLAAVEGADSVSMEHIEETKDKVVMGPERKSRIVDEEANKITAYHEGGHAIVAFYTEDSQPLHKVTIRHRGSSLGHTACIPEKENYHVTKSQLLAKLDMMMGGRAAEELIFGPDKITAGASNDLKHATSIATLMVKEWGMSKKVGFRTYNNSKNNNELSPGTAELIDSEINRLMTESYEHAKNILITHQKEHKLLAENLLKYETLDAKEVESLLKGKAIASTSRTA